VAEALRRFAGVEEVHLVPDDRAAVDAALLAGRVLREVAPTSPAREALQDLAAELTGRPVTGRRSGVRRLLAARGRA
jgi:Flp pilus assembly CpaE family ATPase